MNNYTDHLLLSHIRKGDVLPVLRHVRPALPVALRGCESHLLLPERNPLLFYSQRGILYYSTPREESFTILLPDMKLDLPELVAGQLVSDPKRVSENR